MNSRPKINMRILFVAVLLHSALATAADPVTCITREQSGNIANEIHYAEKFIFRGRTRTGILRSEHGFLGNIGPLVAEWRACNDHSNTPAQGQLMSPRMQCSNEVLMRHLIPADESAALAQIARLGVIFILIQENEPIEPGDTPIKMDLNKVAQYKAYQIGQPTKFGIPGLYEYYDPSGELLGRFYLMAPFSHRFIHECLEKT